MFQPLGNWFPQNAASAKNLPEYSFEGLLAFDGGMKMSLADGQADRSCLAMWVNLQRMDGMRIARVIGLVICVQAYIPAVGKYLQGCPRRQRSISTVITCLRFL